MDRMEIAGALLGAALQANREYVAAAGYPHPSGLDIDRMAAEIAIEIDAAVAEMADAGVDVPECDSDWWRALMEGACRTGENAARKVLGPPPTGTALGAG